MRYRTGVGNATLSPVPNAFPFPMPHVLSRRAEQHATRAAFFLPGFAIAAWAPIVPFAKARAQLDEAGLGLVLLCLGAGSLLAMPLAGALTARFGCRRLLVAAVLLICATLPALALAANPLALGAALFLFGAGVGGMDCTMNMQAVAVERDSGRAMMSGFHAFYSVGGLAGAAAVTLLLARGVAPSVACALAVAAILALMLASVRHWRSDRLAQDGPAFARPRGVVLAIGLLCFVMFLAEGAMLDWSAVFLTQVDRVAAADAGIGYVVFSLAMTLTRLVGDRGVQALGRTRAVVAGALLACAGFVLVATVHAAPAALAGFAAIGIGCANIVPVMFSLAGRQTVMPESHAIPAVSTLGYAGVLAGPALIGFVAHGTSLVFAFACLAAALLSVAVALRRLRI